MKIIGTTFEKLPRERLVIGFEGENLRATVRIDCASVFAEYPNATPALIVKPLFADAYPVVVDRNGTDVDWLITSEILSFSGDGEIQLVFYKGEVICKSAVSKIRVCRSLQVTGDMPDPVAQWIDDANRKLAEVDAQIVELEGMVDTATDAATRAEQSANTASTKAEQAAGSAATATEKATEATNAAGTATAKAEEAALSATQAGNSAVSAADSESGAIQKAAEAAQSAQTAAQKAEQITEAAQIATGKAGEASASATAAQASATNAASSATAAQAAQTAARASETAASASATQAAQSAQGASANAQTAILKAAEASQSASNAATSATNAATSAETASTKAGEAAQSAQAVEETAEQLAESLEQIEQNTQDIADHEQYAEATYATKNDLYKKADIIHNTASGAIASFPDGAEMPVDELKVSIEPMQDLHGYDHPWPAGGGENLLDPNIKYPTGTQLGLTLTSADGYTFSCTGTATSSGAIQTSVVSLADAVILPAGTYISKIGTLSLCNVNGGWIRNQYSNQAFTVDEPFFVKNLYWEIVEGRTYNVNNFIALVKGSTVPTAWTPYANICPVSGFDSVKVTRTGKNLLDSSWLVNPSTDIKQVQVRLKANATYTLSTNASAPSLSVANLFLLLPGETASSVTNGVWASHPKTITTGSEGLAIIGYRNYPGTQIPIDECENQLELGDTATSYEPYQGETYPITFPTEAGTVYGGSLTIAEDGSGVLTVDRASVTYDGDETFGDYAIGSDNYCVVTYPQNKAVGYKKSICDRLPNVDAAFSKTEYGIYGDHPTLINTYFRMPNPNITTKAEFLEWLAENPLHLVYELATPITYSLTAPEITTLLGENNLWHDANGDISVGYKADTKLYIDGKIAELVARIVNS